MENYRRILDVLHSVPMHPEVTPIEPKEDASLSFFPGQRGFIGDTFPVGGVMLCANNFDNLAGWEAWSAKPDAFDGSRTYDKLTNIMLPEAGLTLEQCWLTNYALGVMDRPNNRYEFPRKVREQLMLPKQFQKFADIMHPRLIVMMGGYARGYIGATRGPAETKFGTRVIGTHHPGARVSTETLIGEGRRIREALKVA